MGIPSTNQLSFVLSDIENRAAGAKAQAQSVLTALQTGSVDTAFAFNIIDQMLFFVGFLQAKVGITGLNAYASANIPGYAGTLTADINAVIAAGQDCISWIITAFPKDSTNTYIMAYTFNGDGTRNTRKFSPADTAGLQTKIQTFINTLS